MNERIKELAEQSLKEVIETNDYNGSAYTVREFDKEKFTELIVKECCYVGEQYAEGLFDMKHYDFVNKKIKEHFGVEE